MQKLFRSGDTTVILVSHNLFNIEQICERAIHLEQGQVVMDGQTSQVISGYLYNSNTQYAKHVAGQAAQREGSGEIRFTEVTVNSAHTGEPYLQAGEPITIRAQFKSIKPVEFVRFRIGIQDFTTQTLINLANVDAKNLDSDGEIVCTFSDLHLFPRTYSIYLSATDLFMLYDRWSNSTMFVVSGAGDENLKYSVGEPQLMHIPHSIKLDFKNGHTYETENA